LHKNLQATSSKFSGRISTCNEFWVEEKNLLNVIHKWKSLYRWSLKLQKDYHVLHFAT